MTRQLAAVVEREGDGFVALRPEVDIASQSDSVDEARANLREALEQFFETASESEIRGGTPASIIRQSGVSRGEFE